MPQSDNGGQTIQITTQEVIPMKKRPYRATAVNDIDEQALINALANQEATVGIDVAKEDFVAALKNAEGVVVKTIKWKHPAQSRTFIGLLSKLKQKAAVKLQAALEPTGTYGLALQHLLLSAEVPVFQVSPKHVHDMMEIYDGVPSSHDGKSAAVIATLHQDSKSHRWIPHSDQRRELRARIKQMDLQREHFQRMVNQLEALLAMYWPELPHLLDLDSVTLLALLAKFGSPQEVARQAVEAEDLMRRKGRSLLKAEKKASVLESARTTTGVVPLEVEVEALKWLAVEMQRTASMLKEARETVEALCKDEPFEQLSEVVGKVTSAVLVAVVGDPRDFPSASHFVKAIGLNLRINQSGKKKGQLTITKRGSGTVRQYLFLAALRWVQRDTVAKAWYEKKVVRDGGLKMKAVVALMRKLAKALFWVARGEAFDSEKLFNTKRLFKGQQCWTATLAK